MRLGKFLASVVLSYGLVSCVPAYTAEPAEEINPFHDPEVVSAVSAALEHQCVVDGYLVPASDEARAFFTRYEKYTERSVDKSWSNLSPDEKISADLLLSFQQASIQRYCRVSYIEVVNEYPEVGKVLGLNAEIYSTKGLNDEKVNPSK